MKTHTRADIDDFLREKRLAIVGVSRKEHHFSRSMMREFLHRGYDVVPVNPNAAEIEGIRCSTSLASVNPQVDAALIMTPASGSAAAVADCVQGGVTRIWLYAAVTQGSVTSEAIQIGRASGATVIEGECPFMFLPNAGWFHGVHRFVRSITGALPR